LRLICHLQETSRCTSHLSESHHLGCSPLDDFSCTKKLAKKVGCLEIRRKFVWKFGYWTTGFGKKQENSEADLPLLRGKNQTPKILQAD
jgi:hypothetical protein